MSETVNLTIKIDPELKENLKQLALENQISMSQEIVQRLQSSLMTHPHPSIDNQDTEEEQPTPLNPVELKQIRALLKKQSKKKK